MNFPVVFIAILTVFSIILIQHSFAEEEILILVENDVRKVYYTGENIISAFANPETASVIFETGEDAKLYVKAPKVYKIGPGLFILRDGEEVDAVTDSDECFYYATFETQKPEKIEIVFAAWPEYMELVENCETFTVPPPLKQIKSGILLNEIQCRDSLLLVTKYDGSPACVKPETKTKLIERGWGTMTYLDKTMEVQGTDHSVKYRMDGNATVTNSIYSQDRQSVIITLDAKTSGNLTIELPRTLIDSGHSNCDPYYEREEPFAVLINHEEVLFEEIATTSEKRTLLILFQENTREIEIISFCLI